MTDFKADPFSDKQKRRLGVLYDHFIIKYQAYNLSKPGMNSLKNTTGDKSMHGVNIKLCQTRRWYMGCEPL